MWKQTMYPKTKRVSLSDPKITITEKLDGSNLVIFKLGGDLYIAQRNTVYMVEELHNYPKALYKGLLEWVDTNIDKLNQLRDFSAICGEWLGMGQIKYPVEEFDKKFYMFAKANVTLDDYNIYELENIKYDHENFKYPFESEEIPDCIGFVPIVGTDNFIPLKEDLDDIYSQYCEMVSRPVEGFIVHYNGRISKYVRMKNGKLQDHRE